jgi:hypothetical protein
MSDGAKVRNHSREVEPNIECVIGMPKEQHRPWSIVEGQTGKQIMRMNVQNDCVVIERPGTKLCCRLRPRQVRGKLDDLSTGLLSSAAEPSGKRSPILR